MSEWVQIEDAIISALNGLSGSGQAMLATVRGRTHRERRGVASEIVRERLPAAYVIASGRDEGDKNFRRPGTPVFTVVFASRSERNADEARRSGTDVVGVFAISEAAVTELAGLDLGESRRLMLIEERPIAAEEGLALWEQRYEIRTQAGLFPPMFGADLLVGDASEVQVEVGALTRSASRFAFPGVDGVFERCVGTRERAIIWRGQLRATDEWSLDAIEQDIERAIRSGRVDTLFDMSGRAFHHCAIENFKRRGSRRRDGMTGQILQDFELEFVQLRG